MAIYKYVAMDRAGKTVEDFQDADSEAALSKALNRNGLFLMRATLDTAPRPAPAAAPRPTKKVDLETVATFTEQFVLMVKAALPALETIESLANTQKNPAMKEVLLRVADKLKRGESLSRSFGEHPQVFDSVYINLLSAGEAGGKVPELLARVNDYLVFQIDLRHKIRSAMIYPMVILGASVTVILFLMIFVLPTFVDIFAQFNAPLPFATRALLWTSSTMIKEWYVIVGALLLFGFLGWRWGRQPSVKNKLERMVLRLPIVGSMVQAIVLTRMLRTMAVLIESGVPILNALSLTKGATNHAYFEGLLTQVSNRVSEGKGIASALQESPYFPSTVASMISTAERTGSLPEVLKISADHYQRRLDVEIENTFSALEPLFIGVLSLVVAAIAISILQPIMTLSSAVGG
jgi:type II secretory pathway component PulF